MLGTRTTVSIRGDRHQECVHHGPQENTAKSTYQVLTKKSLRQTHATLTPDWSWWLRVTQLVIFCCGRPCWRGHLECREISQDRWMGKFTKRILLGWGHVRSFWNLVGIVWWLSNPLLAEHNFLLLKTELNKGYWSISQGLPGYQVAFIKKWWFKSPRHVHIGFPQSLYGFTTATSLLTILSLDCFSLGHLFITIIIIIYLYFMSMTALSVCMRVYHRSAWCPRRLQEGTRCPGTIVADSC